MRPLFSRPFPPVMAGLKREARLSGPGAGMTDAATVTASTHDRRGRRVALSRRQKITILGSRGLPVCARRPLEGFSFLSAIQKVHPREYTPEYGRAMMKLGVVRQLLLP
jgi:hypothetical protein